MLFGKSRYISFNSIIWINSPMLENLHKCLSDLTFLSIESKSQAYFLTILTKMKKKIKIFPFFF